MYRQSQYPAKKSPSVITLLVIALVVLVVLFITLIITDYIVFKPDVEMRELYSYNLGQEKGFDEGYELGFESGYLDGFDGGSDFVNTEYEDWLELLEVDYPPNGTIIDEPTKEALAPFTVKTDKYAYFVKLVNDENQTVISFFAHPDAAPEVSVPLGEYTLKYARGTTWHDKYFLFGTETTFYQWEKTLVFTEEGEYYNGYTITTYDVLGGNGLVNEIDKDDF